MNYYTCVKVVFCADMCWIGASMGNALYIGDRLSRNMKLQTQYRTPEFRKHLRRFILKELASVGWERAIMGPMAYQDFDSFKRSFHWDQYKAGLRHWDQGTAGLGLGFETRNSMENPEEMFD